MADGAPSTYLRWRCNWVRSTTPPPLSWSKNVVPGVIGVVLLGDTAQPGLLWLAGVAFAGAVVGAVAVAMFVAVEQAHSGEGRHRLELGDGRPTVYRHRTHRF